MLRRDLERLIEHASAAGMTTGTSTNGSAMTAQRAASLKAAGLDRLQVSLDGLRAEHEAVRGTGAFDKAPKAIRFSLDAGLRTHICFTAMRSNAHLLPDMIALAENLGVDGFNLSQFVPTGRGSLSEGLEPTVAKKLLETWLVEHRRRPKLHMTAHSSGLAALEPAATECRGDCEAGISIGCIMPNGDVTPCVMFPMPIGNLTMRGLRKIWTESPVIDELHARHVKGTCGLCHHRKTRGGCRASAWAVTGDMMAEDPYCWLVDSCRADKAPSAKDQPCLTS